jgi:hypothetical protein
MNAHVGCASDRIGGRHRQRNPNADLRDIGRQTHFLQWCFPQFLSDRRRLSSSATWNIQSISSALRSRLIYLIHVI